MRDRKFRLGNLDRRALGEEVSETLRAAIIEGDLPPGTRLIEAELSEDLGVSRGPVRDALRKLEADKLVVTSPRRGSTVAVFSHQDIEEIFTLRAALEGVGARWLAGSMTDEKAEQLEAALDRMREAPANSVELLESDLDFHRLIATLSGHSRVREAWEHIQPQIEFFMHTPRELYPEKHGVVGWHERTLAALRAGDADTAEATIRAHIQDAAARVRLDWLKEPGASKALSTVESNT